MWLVHSTNKYNLKKILDDGEIKPSSQTNINRHDINLSNVFMSVLFDNVKVLGIREALIFFPIEIMESYSVSHWSSNWNYGDLFDESDEEEVSILYDVKESAKKNTEVWQEWFYKCHPQKMYKTYSRGTSAQTNEVVFSDSIPMGEASFIYLRKDINIDEADNYLYRIDNTRELNKRLNDLNFSGI